MSNLYSVLGSIKPRGLEQRIKIQKDFKNLE